MGDIWRDMGHRERCGTYGEIWDIGRDGGHREREG